MRRTRARSGSAVSSTGREMRTTSPCASSCGLANRMPDALTSTTVSRNAPAPSGPSPDASSAA